MEQQQLDNLKNNKGFVTLLSVIIISAVAVMMVGGMMIINVDSFSNTQKIRESMQAKALAQTCAEVAISKLKSNLTYSGNEILNISGGTCQIQAISGTGNNNRTIQTIGTQNGVVKKIKVVVSVVNPITTIGSWQEVSDF